MRKKAILCFSVLCVLALGLAIAACGDDAPPVPAELATPANFRMEDEILYWDSVEGAEGYRVSIVRKRDGEEDQSQEIPVSETFLDTFEITTTYGVFSMRVTALGGPAAIDSLPTEAIEFTVNQPRLLYMLSEDGSYIFSKNPQEKPNGKLVLPPFPGELVAEAFRDCRDITSVYIPDEIAAIGDEAFRGCNRLRRIRFPQNPEYTTMATSLCSDCAELWDVTIPPNVREIDMGAFFNCSSLKEVVIPASVEKLLVSTPLYSMPPFAGSGITSVTVEEGNPVYYSEGNCIMQREGRVLVEGFATSTVPEDAKAIGDYAFCDVFGLKSVTIPASVEEIGWDAFYCCADLENITLSAVRSIGGMAFFQTALKSLKLPATATDCSPLMLSGCDVGELSVEEGNPVYYSEGNCIIKREGNILFAGSGASAIPDGITEIGTEAFDGRTSLTEITIPASVKKIGSGAFYNCRNLKRLRLPEGLETIERDAFANCPLEGVAIPQSVQKIGQGAFRTLSTTTLFFAVSIYDASQIGYTDGVILINSHGVFFDCIFGYDGAYPYVISWHGVADDNDNVNFGLLAGDDWDISVMAPIRNGYTFAGWATEEGGDIVYPAYTIEKTFSILQHDSAGSTVQTGHRVQLNAVFEGTGMKTYSRFLNELKGIALYAVWTPDGEAAQ